MIPFKKYLGESHAPDWIDSDATVVSFTSLEKLLFERTNLEYCLIVPKNLNARRENETIRSYFSEQRVGLYPVAVGNKKSYGRMYVVTKKPHTKSQDFREMVSDAYYLLENFHAIYTNGCTIKTLIDAQIKNLNEEPSISKFQEIVSSVFGKKTSFYGLEIPINEEIQYHFRKNNLIPYPLTEYDLKYSKNWNDFLND
jgi:hypothetical protein